jgi:hypothetical protein
MPSQSLVNPFYVRFHATTADGTQKAFAMLVTKEDDGEHLSGAVWCDDEDQDAGLSMGWNVRNQIGRGGPGSNVSWSAFDD